MDIKIDPKTNSIRFDLDEKDINDALAVKFIMEHDCCPRCKEKFPNGWKILKDYWEVARESIIDVGMDGIKTRGKKELSAEKWAILKGFTEAISIPDRIVLRLKTYLENQKKTEEDAKNDTGNDE